MKEFSLERKGYSIKEVDDYLILEQIEHDRHLKEKQARINELRQENFDLTRQLNIYKQKEESISLALTNANEKAKEIIAKAKLEYSLELKNLDAFYEKWNNFFNELIKRYPKMHDFDDKKVLSNIKEDIKNIVSGTYQISYKEDNKNSVSVLLDKLKEHSQNKERKKVSLKTNENVNKDIIIKTECELEYQEQNNKINNIKPITNLKLDNEEKEEFESLLDKFLHTNNKISKGYESRILNTNKKSKYPKANSSGFDFEQALNPTDDLSKIMQGFKLD
ncbi:MAG: hypothetical protein E7359_02695 [Clostridiales bacterium]|nr:hypothetical protein [Clostridiales bacterium]